MDIDLNPDTNDPRLRADTTPEGVEYLGRYDSLEAYMRDMLSPEISNACEWILDYVDWRAALRRFEGNGRLVIECGQVFRIAAPTSTRGGR